MVIRLEDLWAQEDLTDYLVTRLELARIFQPTLKGEPVQLVHWLCVSGFDENLSGRKHTPKQHTKH